uniref:RNA polymerase II carboxyterminal domain (CTD) phosphatase, putative n=1 Tax=Theileria annulata TaxID=5874 RepID=A0A3B0MQJ2_THEAN
MSKGTSLINFNGIYTIPEDSNENDPRGATEPYRTEADIAKEAVGLKYGATVLRKSATLIPKRKTLVLDLDETLIHSSFEPSINSFTMPLMQNGVERTIYINKRPYLDEFLSIISEIYDIVIFTAGLKSYADPVIDAIDVNKVCKKRLFRDSCKFWNGYYIKDLEILNRPMKDVITIDNSPCCYCLNPDNAIPIETWFDDENDSQLANLVPLLTRLAQAEDVRNILASLFNNEFIFTRMTIGQIKKS